ncbi:hypothetical protein PUN28_019068 [Cardiocondyla obscurior]|uniref:Uncharacterized protein n=1 Tax=Cardiocondyla obscurior TaxID=286306 RepID=A0AAW2EFE2_9HYME
MSPTSTPARSCCTATRIHLLMYKPRVDRYSEEEKIMKRRWAREKCWSKKKISNGGREGGNPFIYLSLRVVTKVKQAHIFPPQRIWTVRCLKIHRSCNVLNLSRGSLTNYIRSFAIAKIRNASGYCFREALPLPSLLSFPPVIFHPSRFLAFSPFFFPLRVLFSHLGIFSAAHTRNTLAWKSFPSPSAAFHRVRIFAFIPFLLSRRPSRRAKFELPVFRGRNMKEKSEEQSSVHNDEGKASTTHLILIVIIGTIMVDYYSRDAYIRTSDLAYLLKYLKLISISRISSSVKKICNRITPIIKRNSLIYFCHSHIISDVILKKEIPFYQTKLLTCSYLHIIIYLFKENELCYPYKYIKRHVSRSARPLSAMKTVGRIRLGRSLCRGPGHAGRRFRQRTRRRQRCDCRSKNPRNPQQTLEKLLQQISRDNFIPANFATFPNPCYNRPKKKRKKEKKKKSASLSGLLSNWENKQTTPIDLVATRNKLHRRTL